MGILLAFFAGLIPALIWTKDFLTAKWGFRYIAGLVLGTLLYFWGVYEIVWGFDFPFMYENAWIIGGLLVLAGFVSWWVGVPLLEGMAEGAKSVAGSLAKLLIVVILVVGFLYMYNDPRFKTDTEDVFILSIFVVGGYWFLFKRKRSGGHN